MQNRNQKSQVQIFRMGGTMLIIVDWISETQPNISIPNM